MEDKKNTFQRREYQGLATLSKEIKRITAPVLGARGFSGTDILESWADILGPDLSLGVHPEKLVFDKNNRTHGTLHVKSAGGAFAMLFEHQKGRVIDKINSFFGYPAVAHIKIRQGNLSLKKPVLQKQKKPVSKKDIDILTQKVSSIEDENLRQITYNIGLSLLQK